MASLSSRFVNSFTQFVPGHVHLKDLGQLVAREIEKAGGFAKEFNAIAVDDGIAMGHDDLLRKRSHRLMFATDDIHLYWLATIRLSKASKSR